MSVCVCTHRKRDHRRVAMSVPLLPNPEPLYQVAGHPIARAGGPTANVDIDECRCGCCMYESDDGKD